MGGGGGEVLRLGNPDGKEGQRSSKIQMGGGGSQMLPSERGRGGGFFLE